jgi:hypothetical protein
VTRSFGQFQKPAKVQKYADLSPVERQIVKAFQQGEEAGRAGERCDPPYRSTTPHAEAWLCGYAEQARCYVLVDNEA